MCTKSKSHCHGAALVEFAIVLPLLILFIQILMHIGWAFTQLTWVSQTTYHVAMVGSENPVNGGQGPMLGRKDFLEQIQNRWMHGPLGDAIEYDEENSTVAVTLNGQVPAILWAFTQGMGVRVTAPVLVAGDGEVGDLNRFVNPDPFYDCEGNECEGSGPCEPTQCTLIPKPNFSELEEYGCDEC
ncbi:MAG: pilus assembly protein [Bdellovibrionota bacterium]|nr:MAG: pilus assembly protein [Bdellovibrionota bacterium]